MCRLASFIITREGCLWHPESDSHEQIIAYHKLDDRRESDFVRVEITPHNADYSLPLETWEYRVDQQKTPTWYSAKAAEAWTREELTKWRGRRQWFFDAMEFVGTIKDVPWFKGVGKISTAWRVFDTRDAARAAAWDAERDAAWDAARAAVLDAAWDAARDAARAAVLDAARDAAWDAARDAVLDAAWDAAGDAGLLARCLVVSDKINTKHFDHAQARWDVWMAGYGLLCDVGGVLYVYRRP